MDSKKNSWICESEKILLSSPVMDLVKRQCRSSEDERKFDFYILKSRDWCNIIPITEDGNVVMVKQYRIGISDHTIEVPGGVTDPTDTDTKATAIREMQEETGYEPLSGAQCLELGWSFPNPAILSNRCFSFVIGPVRKMTQQNLDPGEMIEVVEVPISEIPKKIINGEINHALMLNTFFLLLMQSDKASNTLLQELGHFSRRHPLAEN